MTTAPHFAEPNPNKGRPYSFDIPMKPWTSPNGEVLQFNGIFGRDWEQNGNYPDAFDKTLEDLGRFHNMYYKWLSHKMRKVYNAMCNDHNNILCRKWELPADRGQRQTIVDNLPVYAFLPEHFEYGIVPMDHLPSKTRLHQLGLIMTDDAYQRHFQRLALRARPRGPDMALGARQFVDQVRRMEQHRSMTNSDASTLVAAAISATTSINVDVAISDEQFESRVTEFAVHADSDAARVQEKFRDQFERMKKHKLLKLHRNRMNVHALLANFDKKMFTYYEIASATDPTLKRCLLSSDIMGPGVEMVRLNCWSVNADQHDSAHVVSVAHLGAALAAKIERDPVHWMNEACCPSCGSLFPAFVVESDAFNLVEQAGGHGKDFKHAVMFDPENMHVEVEELWDISTDLSDVDLGHTARMLLDAANYTP